MPADLPVDQRANARELFHRLDWQASQLCFTAFFLEGQRTPTMRLEALTARPPEKREEVRRGEDVLLSESDPGPESSSPLLTLVQQPDRVDLAAHGARIAAGAGPAGLVPSEVEMGAPVGTIYDYVSQFSLAWITALPAVKRVAFSGIFLRFQPDRRSAYEELRRNVRGIAISPDTDAEFGLRINRTSTMNLGSEVLSLNRIRTWSVLKGAIRMSAASADGMVQMPPVVVERHFLNVLADISTDAGRTAALNSESLGPIFDRMMREAAMIPLTGEESRTGAGE